MIIGKEGQPRSGKSYETVKYDILEAVKAGRKVFARLNGLDHAKIAAYLSLPLEHVVNSLVLMDDTRVHEWLVCNNEGSVIEFPHLPKGALVIVDECHEFWPVGRAALPAPTANFFAKHGHISLDVVLMTQDFKEVHRSVVRRMQRKNVYTKLDALGKDDSYSIRFYTAPTAGKFELMGSEKRDYDATVFDLYDGVQPGVDSNPVYKTGSRTLWQTAKKPAIAVALAVAFGIFMLARFFMGGGAPEAEAKTVAVEQGEDAPQPVAVPPGVPRVAEVVPVQAEPEPPRPYGVAHVLDLAKKGRPRYAGSMGDRHVLEFRASHGHVVDRLLSEQVEALGWEVQAHPFGVLLVAGDDRIVFTAWPLDLPGSQSAETAQRITAAGPPVMSASESQPAPAPRGSGPAISAPNEGPAYGGFR